MKNPEDKTKEPLPKSSKESPKEPSQEASNNKISAKKKKNESEAV